MHHPTDRITHTTAFVRGRHSQACFGSNISVGVLFVLGVWVVVWLVDLLCGFCLFVVCLFCLLVIFTIFC